MTKANKKSLGAFRNHYSYQHEMTRGYNRGYMGLIFKKMASWGVMFNIGIEQHKNRTFRQFASSFINYQRKATLEELLKLRNAKRGRWLLNGDVEKQQVILMALRLSRKRIEEEIVKGDEELARRAEEEAADVSAQ